MNDNNTTPLGVHQTPVNYDIYAALKQERQYQTAKWGNFTDDNENGPNEFVAYITRYATGWMNGEFAPFSSKAVDDFRVSMQKVAALAIAAIESLDRQRDEAGHAFYEATAKPSFEAVVSRGK